MVAFFGESGEHDEHHDGDGKCPSCLFIERVGDLITDLSEGDAQGWQDVAGELIDSMHSALWALQRVRAEATTDYADEIDNAGEAARSLSRLGHSLDHLWHTVMDDDQADDPGTAL